MEIRPQCFNEFPDQCSDCPEYRETRHDPTAQFVLMSGIGMYPPEYRMSVVKECKKYHKRKVEYLKY